MNTEELFLNVPNGLLVNILLRLESRGYPCATININKNRTCNVIFSAKHRPSDTQVQEMFPRFRVEQKSGFTFIRHKPK